MRSKTDTIEVKEEPSKQIKGIESDLEEGSNEDSEVEEAGGLLEPEENVFSRRSPTFNIAKAGYISANPEDWLLKGENEPTDDAFFRNFGGEIGAGAAIGAVGAHAFDPTGLYSQALSDPDPLNITIAGTAGLVGNSLYGAGVGGLFGAVQKVARSMTGATLAASGATYSFMTNNVLRGLEQGEKYLRSNQDSEIVDTTVKIFDKATAEAEAFYDRLRNEDDRETYSPETLDDLQQRFSELEKYGDIEEVETSVQTLTDKSEIPEIIDYLQNEENIEIRDEDIQIEEREEGRVAKYHGTVDFHHKIDGESYRVDDETYAIEFEALLNQSDAEKINL